MNVISIAGADRGRKRTRKRERALDDHPLVVKWKEANAKDVVLLAALLDVFRLLKPAEFRRNFAHFLKPLGAMQLPRKPKWPHSPFELDPESHICLMMLSMAIPKSSMRPKTRKRSRFSFTKSFATMEATLGFPGGFSSDVCRKLFATCRGPVVLL
jgi:hypothetical protein